MADGRRPGQRAGLTRERVLAAARELLAERGAEGLTMRALAERLRVAPNALYSHVEGRTALVEELLDDALSAVDAPAPDVEDPLGGVHALLTSTYELLLEHAELLPLYLARQGARGPNARRLGDVMLALLARRGVTGTRADEALHVLIVYTIGAAAFASRSPLAADRPTRERDHVRYFDRGLRWILAGLGAGAPHS